MSSYPEDHQTQYGNTGPPPSGGRHIPPPPPPASGLAAMTAQSCLVAGCVTVLVPAFMVAGFFLLVYLMASRSVDQAGSGLGSIYQGSSQRGLVERELRGGSGGAVAVVALTGVIEGGGSTLEGGGSMAFVAEQLRAACENEEVAAIILQVDSPGGGLTASDQLHDAVTRARESGKPILAWAGSMMASGGYYIAVAADEIMASPTSTIGSIGVIMQHFQVRDFLDKIGVKVEPIASGERKDLASPFREMTPAERALLQAYIDSAHRRFVDIVAKGRDMPEEKVRALADGGIFTAEAAVENGLVDSIGGIEDALRWAEEKAGRSGMRVIGYRRAISLGELFGEAGRGASAALVEAARAESVPRAMAVYDGE